MSKKHVPRPLMLVLLLFAVSATAIAAVSTASAASRSDGTAGANAGNTAATIDSTVAVTLNEWSVAPVPASVSAGSVTFAVTNAGKIGHELVLLKTDLDPAKLPLLAASDLPKGTHIVGDVKESGLTSPGEVEDVVASTTKTATFPLDAGRYVLLCNLPGHYAAGMYRAFTVTAAPAPAAPAPAAPAPAAPALPTPTTQQPLPARTGNAGMVAGPVGVPAPFGVLTLIAVAATVVAGGRAATGRRRSL